MEKNMETKLFRILCLGSLGCSAWVLGLRGMRDEKG